MFKFKIPNQIRRIYLQLVNHNKRGSDSSTASEESMDNSSIFSSTATLSSTASTSSLPPGPSGLPVVGSVLEYKGPQTNLKWTENYGPIYYVRMGNKNLVYLNRVDLVEKYMEGRNGEQFLGRPMGPAAIGEGLLFGNGDKWLKNKRAFMRAMHTTTLMEDMEGAIQSELVLAMEQLQRKALKGKPFRIGNIFLPTCANAISGLLLGGALPQDCPERESLHKIVKNLEGVDLSSSLTQITLKYPKMREPLKKIFFKDIVDMHGTSRRLQRLLRQWIRQTKSGEIFKIQSEIYQQPSFAERHDPEHNKCPLDQQNQTEQQRSRTCEIEKGTGSRGQLCLKLPPQEPGHEQSESQPVDPANNNALDSHDDKNAHKTTDESRSCSEDDDDDSDDNHLHPQSSAGRTSLKKNFFISTESLLTVPSGDQTRAEDIMQDEANLASLGFSSVGPGEREFEPVEPSALAKSADCPLTPLTEFEWKFHREMSINERHESTLHRILAQPEYAGVTEENDAELLQSLVDLFFGGVTSTLSGLEFILLYLSKNPTMQMLAQQEISRVLAGSNTEKDSSATNGHGAVPKGEITWSMRDSMPYLRACVTEGLRLGSVTPSSLPHVATVDTEIEGYSIPKNTFVLASIYSLHRDPNEYIDPQDYRPQRHLDHEGCFRTPHSYRPYGVGARLCIGDRLAEMELFLYTATILRDFNVISPPNSKKASAMETYMRIIHRLKDFKCVLQKRK